jgi:flavodoxin
MRALIVYESMFGNTRQIAEAVAEGLRAGHDAAPVEVGLVEVGEAPATVADVDLLVVGGPTHALGMSRPETRQSATEHTTNRW